MLSPKENLLRTLRRQNADWAPFGLEPVKAFSHRDARFYRGNGFPGLAEWTDAWGVGFRAIHGGLDGNGYPVSHPLESLDALERFPFPDPEDPGVFAGLAEAVQAVDRDQCLVLFHNPGFLFVRSWLLRGMDNALADMLEAPDRYEALLERIFRYQEAILRRTLAFRPDMVHFGDDAGTTRALLMDPALWRKMVLPRLRRVVAQIKDAGCLAYMHCCGRVDEIIEDIIGMGVDLLDPVQAGANDLALLKRKARGRLAFLGGMDSHVLMTGTPEDAARVAREAFRALGEGGGYVAGPDQSLPFPEANLRAIRRVVEEKGGVPA